MWNTHLRKRVVNQIPSTISSTEFYNSADHQETNFEQFKEEDSKQMTVQRKNPPQKSSSEISSVTTNNNFPAVDEIFWSEVFSGENSGMGSYFPGDPQLQIPLSQLYGYDSNVQDGSMDYWYDLLKRGGGEIPELVEF